ncbi:PREDICTED: uncharacterized protein LOC106113323 [Papilio xuthus]|uniref:Uncharacterized protein LOC106113323 n=1 Tax=Papilio xuthus TaxID=66420 RepID=A0AAJ6YYK2_PAPXU|nr:PREDICTED: uncharacterized protein LOC106113323 [Papilio xuthus]
MGSIFHVICGVYIPPNQDLDIYTTFLNLLQYYFNNMPIIDKIYIAGDFNLPYIEWIDPSTQTYSLPCDTNNALTTTMSIFLRATHTRQYNYIKNNMGRILDLFISNDEACCCEPVLNPLVYIDCLHPPFHVRISWFRQRKTINSDPTLKYYYVDADYAIINENINSHDWLDILQGYPVNTACMVFYEKLNEIIKSNVPVRPAKSTNYPIWFNRPLIHIFKDKEKAWIKWKKYNSIAHYEEFSILRKRFKTLSKQCFNNYIAAIEDSLKQDVKKFWSFIKTTNKKSGIPSCMKYNGVVADEPEKICNLFAKFFGSVYEQSDKILDTVSSPFNDICNTVLSDYNITKDCIIVALKSLDISKGAGPDGIPPFFLKHTAESISTPLHILYNKSLQEGTVPNVWKLANVTPVYKSGNENIVSNYRPISLLSTLAKRVQVDAVYTDFCKAFDKLDQDILLQKLAFNGIRGNLLRWFSSYVKNRSQQVCINGFTSEVIKVTSGII